MKKTSTSCFLLRAFALFAAMALPLASASAASVPLSVEGIYLEEATTFRTGDPIRFLVATDPLLDATKIPADFTLKFRFSDKNSAAAKEAAFEEMLEIEGTPILCFSYTVQPEDTLDNAFLYPYHRTPLFGGSLSQLKTVNGDSIRSYSTIAPPDASQAITTIDGDSRLYINPKVTLTIDSIAMERTGTFRTNDRIGILVTVDHELDPATIPDDFAFKFYFSDKDSYRLAVIDKASMEADNELFFAYTVVDTDFSTGELYPYEYAPVFVSATALTGIRTTDGDSVTGVNRISAPNPDDAISSEVIVNPDLAKVFTINFLDPDNNPFSSTDPYDLEEGQVFVKYCVNVGRIPTEPLTISIDWGAANVFGEEQQTTVTIDGTSSVTNSIAKILDDGAAGSGSHIYTITASKGDGSAPATMIARVKNIQPEFINLPGQELLFGIPNGSNTTYAVGQVVTNSVQFNDVAGALDKDFTVDWYVGATKITGDITELGNSWLATAATPLAANGANNVSVTVRDKNGGTISTNAVYWTKEGAMLYADPAESFYLGLANLGDGTISILQPGNGAIEWVPQNGTPLTDTDNDARLRANPYTDTESADNFDSFIYKWFCEGDIGKDTADTTRTLIEGGIARTALASVNLKVDRSAADSPYASPSVKYLFSKEKYRPDNFGDIDGDGLGDTWEMNWLQEAADNFTKPNSDEVVQAAESASASYDEGGNLVYDFSNTGNMDGDGLPADCFATIKHVVEDDIVLKSDPGHAGYTLSRGVYDVKAFLYPLDIKTIRKYGYFPLGGSGISGTERNEVENFKNSEYVDSAAKATIDNLFVNFDNLTEFRGIGEYVDFFDGTEEITFRPYGDGDEPGTRPDKADTDNDGRPDGWEYYFWAVAYYNINPDQWVRFDGIPNGDTFRGSGTPITRAEILAAFSPTSKGSNDTDTDGDGLTDFEEYILGTNPIHWDTDGDGMPDGWEVDNGVESGTATSTTTDENGATTTVIDNTVTVNLNPLNPDDGNGNPDGDWMAYYTDPETGVEYRHFSVYARLDFDPRTAWCDPNVQTVSYADNTFNGVTYANTRAFSNREEFDFGAWAVQNGLVPYVSSDPNDDYYWNKVCPFPGNPDSDGDGIPDGWEAYVGIPEFAGDYHTSHNPLDARDGSQDAERYQTGSHVHGDGDGLNNFNEFLCTMAIDQYDYLSDHAAEAAEWPNKPWPTNPNISLSDIVGGSYGLGFADGCDTDSDQILDSFEKGPNTNPTCVDTDHDWLPDAWECYFGTDPLIRDTFEDYDGDGLQNWQEYLTGAVWSWQYDKWYDLARIQDGFGPKGPGYGEVDMFDFFVSAGDRDTFGSIYGGFGRHPHPWDVSYGARSRIVGQPETTYLYYFLIAEPRSGNEPKLVPSEALAAHGISDLGEPRDQTGMNDTLVNGETEQRWTYTQDAAQGGLCFATTDPWNDDSDDDGMSDYYEAFHGLNPLYGGSAGTDIVGKTDPLNSNEPYPTEPWDLLSYPWLVGDPLADPDKDGLASIEEAPNFFVVGGTHHTDPSPLWITDSSYERSFVNLYYTPGRIMRYGLDDEDIPALWYFGLESGGSAPYYAFSFESNEGYDTDNDNVPDRSEVTIDELRTKADPIDFDNPRRRKALYLNGVDAAARTKGAYVVGNLDRDDYNTVDSDSFDLMMKGLDDLRNFTVEAWICPEEPVAGRVQTILERGAIVPQDTAKDGTTAKRLNFRLSITPAGALRGEFHNYQGAHVTMETDAANTGLRAGVWTHVAMTYSGHPDKTGTLTIYVNGTSYGSTPSSLQAFNGIVPRNMGMFQSANTNVFELGYSTVACPIVVGASDANPSGEVDGHVSYDNGNLLMPGVGPQLQDFFKGWIDEVRIWDGAASPEAIRTRMYKRFDRRDVAANHFAPADHVAGNDVTIRYHYSFDNLPDVVPAINRDPEASLYPSDVETLPVGFEEIFTAPVDGSYPGVPWWDTAATSGYRYDPRHIPWIENTVAHTATDTIKDDVRIQSVRDSVTGEITGWFVNRYEASYGQRDEASSALVGIAKYEGIVQDVSRLPNTTDPYGVFYTTAHYSENTVNGDYDADEGASSGQSDVFDWASDMLPLGGAVADFDVELWDGLGVGYDIASVDTDGDGIPDWWEYLHGLDPFDHTDAWDDDDHDGLDNLGEFLAGTSPHIIDTDGDGYPDYYDRDTDKSLTYGELYDDGDLMPSWWEYLYGLNPRKDDGAEDPDGDGWSNYSEYLAGTDPRQTTDHPVPPVIFDVWYSGDSSGGDTDGNALSGDLYVFAYKDPEMQGRPSAVYMQNLHPKDNGYLLVEDEWLATIRNGKWTYTGQLALANVANNGGMTVEFYTEGHRLLAEYSLNNNMLATDDQTQAAWFYCNTCKKYYSRSEMTRSAGSTIVSCPRGHTDFAGYLGSSQDLWHGDEKWGTIDHDTGTWSITIPKSAQEELVGKTMVASYNALPNPVFPFQMRQKWTNMKSGTKELEATSDNGGAEVTSGGSHAHDGLYGNDTTGSWIVSDGHLREGETRFFAFLDQNENALYDRGEPAGMAVYQPVGVGPGAVEVTIPLTDSLTGYPRFGWEPVSETADGQPYGASYFVTLKSGTSTLLDKYPVSSRPWFMENDVASTHGIPLGRNQYMDYAWMVYTNVSDDVVYAAGTNRMDVWATERKTLNILFPAEGSVESDPSFPVKWVMDWRNEGVCITVRNTDTGTTYIDEIVNHPQRFGSTYDNDYYFAIEPQKILGESTFVDLPDGHYKLTVGEYLQNSGVNPSDSPVKQSKSVNFIIDHTGSTDPNPKVDPLGSISGTLVYYGKIPFTMEDEIVGTYDGKTTHIAGLLSHSPVPGAVTVRVINGATTNLVATDAGALEGFSRHGLVSEYESVLATSYVTYGDNPSVSLELDYAPSAGSRLVVSYKQFDIPIRIQAFSTSGGFQRDAATDNRRLDGNEGASFSGTPVAQITVYNKGVFTLDGLPWGTYYLRAFIDQDRDRVLDSWESVGYAMTIVRSDYGMANYQAIEVAPGARGVEIVIKDRDTDSDQLPDSWEYYYYKSLAGQGGFTQKKAGIYLWQEYADGELDSNPLVEDTDGDGLPDVIEHQIGSNNHAWDSDGDGIGDLEEFLAGSDPTEAASKAHFAAPAPGFAADGTPVIILDTPYLTPGTYLKYQLFAKGSLAEKDWTLVGESPLVGKYKDETVGQPAGTVEIADPDGKGADASFYKVKALFESDTLLD